MVHLPFCASVHAAEVLGIIVERAADATNVRQMPVEGLHVALPVGCFHCIHAYLNLYRLELYRPQLWDVGVDHAQVAEMANRTCRPAVIITRLPQANVSDEGSVSQPSVWIYLCQFVPKLYCTL